MLSPHGYYIIILFIFQGFSECRGKIIRVTFHSTLTPACDRRSYPPPPNRQIIPAPAAIKHKRTAPAGTGAAENYLFFLIQSDKTIKGSKRKNKTIYTIPPTFKPFPARIVTMWGLSLLLPAYPL